jgi:predicted kinase
MAELDIDLYDEPARARIEALQRRLAEELLKLGHTVIVEWGFWARSERDALRLRARGLGAAVELRYLDVPIDRLWDRLRTRRDERPWATALVERADLVRWASKFEAPDAHEQSLYDPSDP